MGTGMRQREGFSMTSYISCTAMRVIFYNLIKEIEPFSKQIFSAYTLFPSEGLMYPV